MAVNAVAAGLSLDRTPEVDVEHGRNTQVDLDQTRTGDAVWTDLHRPARRALLLCLVLLVLVAGLTGWLGYRGYQAYQAKLRESLYLQTARQGAINLTTINYSTVAADVQRILDSATGTFYDDFRQRSQPFVEVVRQAKSTSVGTVTASGVESESGEGARVLVAVTVRTSNATGVDQDPRSWRMRIAVQRVGHGAKVSNVEFVP